jgi:hypothetical protein
MMHHNLKPKEHKEARFIKAIDSGLHYGVLIPSKVEWMRTFGDDKYYGPMHLWIRCIGTTLRSYFYIETMGEGDYLSTPEERVKMFTNNITLLADGVPITSVITDAGGEFYLELTNDFTHTGEISISVLGWLHYARFPINECSRELINDDITAPIQYIINTYTKDQGSGLSTNVPAMVHAIANHLLFHKCSLNISHYEVAVAREHIPYFLNNSQLATFASSGFLTFLVKGIQLNY